MAATVDSNSYVTEAQADTYFSDKYGYEAWGTLTSELKNAALVSAAQSLDLMCVWYGDKADSEQALAFPRTPDASPTPQAVKDSQCEIAYAIVVNESTSQKGDDPLNEMKVGPLTFKFDPKTTGNPLVNTIVEGLLYPFGRLQSTGSTRIVPLHRG